MVTLLVFLHILGAAIWAGGMIFIGMVGAGSRRVLDERERTELFRVVGNGFLVLGGVAAVLLAISGNFLVEEIFGGWSELSGEASDLILWKTVLFIIVLSLAGVHGLLIGPGIRRLRLRRAEGGLSGEEEIALRRRIRLSAASQVLMLAGTLGILLLAADLIS